MALSSDTDRLPERSPWASPDPRPRGAGTPFGTAPTAATARTPVWHDVRAGLLTIAVTVLVGAPVGLLWAALAPRVTVEVTDDGRGPVAGGPTGFGLRGMAERVAAVGGTLVTGAGPAGGFEVRAELPR